jgi:hypothetical protein
MQWPWVLFSVTVKLRYSWSNTPEEFSSLVSNFPFKSAIKLEKDDWPVTARAAVLAVPQCANLILAAALLSAVDQSFHFFKCTKDEFRGWG